MKMNVDKVQSLIMGSLEEYERLEPNYFGRNNQSEVEKQLSFNAKNYKYVICGLILILVLMFLKGLVLNDGLIYEDGKLVGLLREDIDKPQSFNLNVNTEDKSQEVVINLKTNTTKVSDKVKRDEDYYIEQMVRSIEQNRGKEIDLPEQLENGKSISWQKAMDYSFVYVLILSALIVFLLRQGRYSKLKVFKGEAQEDILRELPGFINKLIITWKSGATLEQAIYRAISSSSREGFFYNQLRLIHQVSQRTGDDLLLGINEFAISTQVREFKRLSNIMVENRNKGSFLLEKLEYERQDLWEKRKVRAIEEGKKAETKLVIPMTILLITLIVVTSAPAFLEM